MRVLVTNDDGVDAPGIAALARAVHAAGHEVVVIAPSSGFSGAAAAIGDLAPGAPIGVVEGRIDGIGDAVVRGVDGPPGLCVILAGLGAFGPRPDLVVSGVNAGLNTGRSVLHSGTIGAALTAANQGISGIAVSIAGLEPAHFDTAAALAAGLVEPVAAAPAGTVVNLNVPDLPADAVVGFRAAEPATWGEWTVDVRSVADEKIELGLRRNDQPLDPETDTALVEAGHATVTVLVGPRSIDPDGARRLAEHLEG